VALECQRKLDLRDFRLIKRPQGRERPPFVVHIGHVNGHARVDLEARRADREDTTVSFHERILQQMREQERGEMVVNPESFEPLDGDVALASAKVVMHTVMNDGGDRGPIAIDLSRELADGRQQRHVGEQEMHVLRASALRNFLSRRAGGSTARHQDDPCATTGERNAGGARNLRAASGDDDCLFQ
jgi:hypothetical protein